MAKHTCSICSRKAVKIHGHCRQCEALIRAMRAESRHPQPVKYLTYRGYVVGLYKVGKDTLHPRVETRKAETLPKAKTLDLNVWCEGFTRDKVKEFKACVLSLCSPAVRYVKGG